VVARGRNAKRWATGSSALRSCRPGAPR